MSAPIQQTPLQQFFGDFAPKMADLIGDVLFADVWEREELSKRDRSLITLAALIANGDTESLPGYLNRAKQNGVTKDEVAEVITHLAFYAGWPRATSAFRVAQKSFEE